MEILRFILSICVVLTHIDFLNGTEFAYLKLMGSVAVTSFFILSGYIIPKALDLNYFKRGGVLMGGEIYSKQSVKSLSNVLASNFNCIY